MSHDEPQPYISYRAEADQFRIRFTGGQLDGAEIVTDVFPDNELFVHRVSGRDYQYRYCRTGRLDFTASLHGFEGPQRPVEPKGRDWFWPTLIVTLGAVLLLGAMILGMRR